MEGIKERVLGLVLGPIAIESMDNFGQSVEKALPAAINIEIEALMRKKMDKLFSKEK